MFDLPKNTKIQRVIPKNAFDSYTSIKQKKAFSDKIKRITWTNKIAFDTININGINVLEIQIFKIELKEKTYIKDILTIIERAIPYHIIFWIEFDNECYISTSAKHIHPQKEDIAIIDYTFASKWFLIKDNRYKIELKYNLDWIFKSLCDQLKSINTVTKTINELIEKQRIYDTIFKEIEQLNSEIVKCKQFNKKVTLNLRLKELTKKLEDI